MLSFSEYRLIEQMLMDHQGELDEGFWDFVGKHFSGKPETVDQMKSKALKVNALRHPKEVEDALNSDDIVKQHAAAEHPLLGQDAIKAAISGNSRMQKSTLVKLQNRLEREANRPKNATASATA